MHVAFLVAAAICMKVKWKNEIVQVVMRSGDAELEMRGRCSAGQKVRVSMPFKYCFVVGLFSL